MQDTWKVAWACLPKRLVDSRREVRAVFVWIVYIEAYA